MKWSILVLGVLMLLGCSESRVPEPGADAGSDAEPMLADAAADARDPNDLDGDGVARDADCDDADPAVGRATSRRCDTACGAGTEECRDAAWEACTAPTDCLCTAGQMRTVACEMCGMQPQRCSSSGMFENDGVCLYQGPCRPGDVEDDMRFCGHRRRLCGSDCQWLDWDVVRMPGVCEPGTRVTCRGGGSAQCNDDCGVGCVPA